MEVADSNIRERISETFPDAIFWDDLDGSIIGVSTDGRVIYSMERLLNHFQSNGMSEDESMEHVDFNILCVYVGEHTPIHMWEDSIDYD